MVGTSFQTVAPPLCKIRRCPSGVAARAGRLYSVVNSAGRIGPEGRDGRVGNIGPPQRLFLDLQNASPSGMPRGGRIKVVRRRRPVRGWIGLSAAATIGATAVALLPVASPSAAAAHASRESAARLLSDACRATEASPAFRVRGEVDSGGSEIHVDLYFGSAGELLTMTEHGNQTLNAVVSGPSTYVKANRAFWQSATKSSGAASLLEGKWIDMTADKKDAAGVTKGLDKGAIMSQCGQGWSTAYAGETEVNGTEVTEVHQDSRDGSDTESNTYSIEKGATPYLLRIAGSETQKDSGSLVLTDFGVQPNTTAPPGAIPISQFQ